MSAEISSGLLPENIGTIGRLIGNNYYRSIYLNNVIMYPKMLNDEYLNIFLLSNLFDIIGVNVSENIIKKNFRIIKEEIENTLDFRIFSTSEWLIDVVEEIEKETNLEILNTKITIKQFYEFLERAIKLLQYDEYFDEIIKKSYLESNDDYIPLRRLYKLNNISFTNLDTSQYDKNIKSALYFLYPITVKYPLLDNIREISILNSQDDISLSDDVLYVYIDESLENHKEYILETFENRFLKTYSSNDRLRNYLWFLMKGTEFVFTLKDINLDSLEDFSVNCKFNNLEFIYSGKINEDIFEVLYEFD